jgi:hypothetical protein
MTSPETFYMKSTINEHSFPLVTYMAYFDTRFGHYGFLKSSYSAELIPDRTDRWVNFSDLWPKKHQSWWGLFMDSVDHLTSFRAPTHTHIFGNQTFVTVIWKQPMCGVLRIAVKLILQRFWNLDSISKSTRVMIFKFVHLLNGLGNLMICTHDLTILTKTKETTHYCESFGLRWQNRSQHVFLPI